MLFRRQLSPQRHSHWPTAVSHQKADHILLITIARAKTVAAWTTVIDLRVFWGSENRYASTHREIPQIGSHLMTPRFPPILCLSRRARSFCSASGSSSGSGPLVVSELGKIWMFPKIVGFPKSSSLIVFSTINHPFWGTPIFGNTHLLRKMCWSRLWLAADWRCWSRLCDVTTSAVSRKQGMEHRNCKKKELKH